MRAWSTRRGSRSSGYPQAHEDDAERAVRAGQDADIFEVLISQMRECRNINPVFGKALGVLGHAEAFEPVRDLLHRRSRADLPATGRG